MTHALTLQAVSTPGFAMLSALHNQLDRPVRLGVGLVLGVLTSLGGLTATAIAETNQRLNLSEGTHVFGEVAQPDQIGVTYMVLQVEADQVIGAFYQPASSFDCFRGQIQAGELQLTIRDSYDQTTYPYAMTLQSQTQVASQTGGVGTVVPAGLQALPQVSDLDREILATCQAH